MVLAVLVVAFVAGLFTLDRILLSQVRKQTDALSRELGRPITVGGVATKLWGGLGVRVTDVAVGAGEGEGVPLAQLRRVEVRASVLRAVRTRGKELHVREAVVEGLRVNVVKLPDGTTNLQRFTDALAKMQGPAKPAQPAEAPGGEPAIRVLRVDRAAVENARIGFLDRTVTGAQELAVDDLDIEVRGLETGKPVELTLRAAVLATRQNLELRVKAAPLAPSLEPVPEEIVLKVEPIVLDPLAPFLPPAVGFRGGRFQADLALKLGAAVPGGSGPTQLKGGFRATQLAFAGQEGGKALDAQLDADLEADAAAGTLRIDRLELAVGPAGLSGKGRASGLRSDAPRFEGLEITTRNLDPEALAVSYPPLRKQLGGIVVAGPIGVSVRGSGTQEAQTAVLRLDLTPVRLVVPAQLAKAAGAPLVLSVQVAAAQGGGRVRFDAAADLAGVDLRPGGALAKGPRDPLALKVTGSYHSQAGAQEIRLDRLDVTVLADHLLGSGDVRLAGAGPKATTRFEAQLTGARLDLDRLLIPGEPAKAPPAKTAPPAKPLDPAAFSGLSGTAALRLGALRMKKLEARDVVVRVHVQGDEVKLEEARLVAFGGTISAAGTHLALARPDAPFAAALDLKGVASEDVLRLLGDHKVLAGKLDTVVKVTGTGWKVGLLQKSVTGDVDGVLRDGQFLGKDLVGSVAGPLADKLPFASSRLTERASTSLGKELPFGFKIVDGTATLKRPLHADAGDTALTVEGGVRLDGTLEMPATLALSPALIGKITRGRAKPKAAIPVTFRLGGPAWKPTIESLALGPAVRAIAEQAVGGAVGKALGVEGGSVDEVAAKKRAEAEARAREETEKGKKKLEDEAKKKLRGLFGR